MGKYINGIGITAAEKVTMLSIRYKATPTDSGFKPNLVCVVDNGHFAAAAYAYSKAERDDFAREDGRPKTWLIVPEVKDLID